MKRTALVLLSFNVFITAVDARTVSYDLSSGQAREVVPRGQLIGNMDLPGLEILIDDCLSVYTTYTREQCADFAREMHQKHSTLNNTNLRAKELVKTIYSHCRKRSSDKLSCRKFAHKAAKNLAADQSSSQAVQTANAESFGPGDASR